jgi:MFS family permease
MVSQVLGSGANASAFAFLALLAADLSGTDNLAGVPAATLTLGTAMVATPLARRAIRRGRRSALVTGYLIGTAGALGSFWAGQVGNLPLLLVALLAFGATQAAGLQTRFAAADHALPEQRARAIALVVWVGAFGGVAAPALAKWENDLGLSMGVRPWVAPFMAASVFSILAALWTRARLQVEPVSGSLPAPPRWEQTWEAIRSTPAALLGIVTVALSQAAMVAVMTMTPIHMRDHGQAELSGFVIALHVLGMFGLAPLVGRFVDRAGSYRAIVTGGAILAAGVLASVVAGYQPVLIFAGLFLLGLGWNFGLIAGSTLLTSSIDASHRVSAQGMSDSLLSILGGLAALTSGFIKQGWGFHWLANLSFCFAIVLVAWALAVARRRRSVASQA